MMIRDCLGRERAPYGHVFPDGSYTCPFCWAAVHAAWKGCRNPACFARVDPPYPVERAREVLARDEAAKAERVRRVQLEEWQRKERERRALEEERWRGEQIAEAAKRGACLLCLFQSGYREVKFVRHRKGCPRKGRGV